MNKANIVMVLKVVSIATSLVGAVVGSKLQEKQIADAVEKALEAKGKS